MKGKDKTNLGCRSKDLLEALYRAGVLRFMLGCDGIWDSFRARHERGQETRLFPGNVVYLLPGKSRFLCSLFAVHTNQYHRISRLIYLFIYLLYSSNREVCLCSEHRCAREVVALRAWAKVWGVFWGCFPFALVWGFFEESWVLWRFFQLEKLLSLCNFLCCFHQCVT